MVTIRGPPGRLAESSITFSVKSIQNVIELNLAINSDSCFSCADYGINQAYILVSSCAYSGIYEAYFY